MDQTEISLLRKSVAARPKCRHDSYELCIFDMAQNVQYQPRFTCTECHVACIQPLPCDIYRILPKHGTYIRPAIWALVSDYLNNLPFKRVDVDHDSDPPEDHYKVKRNGDTTSFYLLDDFEGTSSRVPELSAMNALDYAQTFYAETSCETFCVVVFQEDFIPEQHPTISLPQLQTLDIQCTQYPQYGTLHDHFREPSGYNPQGRHYSGKIFKYLDTPNVEHVSIRFDLVTGIEPLFHFTDLCHYLSSIQANPESSLSIVQLQDVPFSTFAELEMCLGHLTCVETLAIGESPVTFANFDMLACIKRALRTNPDLLPSLAYFYFTLSNERGWTKCIGKQVLSQMKSIISLRSLISLELCSELSTPDEYNELCAISQEWVREFHRSEEPDDAALVESVDTDSL